MRSLVWRVLAAAGIVGCAASPDGPASLETMLAREAPVLPTSAFEHPTGLFRARVPGELLQPLEDSSRSAYGQFEIGAENPVACHFFFDRVDLASTLVQSTDVIFDRISSEVGAEVQRAVERIDAGAIAGSPFLALDWLFWMEAGGGEFKQRAASRAGRSVYCAHDSPGLAASFERFFAALVETLEYPGEKAPEPFYHEISVTSFRKQRVGVSELRFEHGADGDVRVETVSATLTPVRSDSVKSKDSHQLEWSQRNGAIINAYYAAVGDEGVTELKLSPAQARSWSVEGRYQSKPIRAEFESKAELASSYGEYLVYLALASGEQSFSIERWLPEAGPAAATPFDFARSGPPSEAGIPVRAQMGPLAVDLFLDSGGRLSAAVSTLPEVDVRSDLVHSVGEIAAPAGGAE
jgi:hypothetical protein